MNRREAVTATLILTPESFGIGGWHPEMNCDSEVFLGIVPPFVFELMGWNTKRQGHIINGEGAVFVIREEMIRAAHDDSQSRGALLKTLLKTEKTRRMIDG